MKSKRGQVLWVVLVIIAIIGFVMLIRGSATPQEILEKNSNIKDKTKVPESESIYCVTGKSWNYETETNTALAKIVGIKSYNNKSLCKAIEIASHESPNGQKGTETAYYFNENESEVYVVTTVIKNIVTPPNKTEVHFINGQVVSKIFIR